MRELLEKDACLRNTMNNWFSHGLPLREGAQAEPEVCCSWCMQKCVLEKKCSVCEEKLRHYLPGTPSYVGVKPAKLRLANFLRKLDINESTHGLRHSYNEESLSEAIIDHVYSASSVKGLEDFLSIFSLGDALLMKIQGFVIKLVAEIGKGLRKYSVFPLLVI